MLGTANVRKSANSSDRVVSNGNSKQVSRWTIRWWSRSGSSRRISSSQRDRPTTGSYAAKPLNNAFPGVRFAPSAEEGEIHAKNCGTDRVQRDRDRRLVAQLGLGYC